MSSKKRIEDAIAKYLSKNTPKIPSGKKNKKPERIVQDAIKSWLDANGFMVSIVNSQATFNFKANRYLSNQTIKGHSDISGCDKNGIGVFIECKAPKKRSTLKQQQREFLETRILANCFACCADSVEYVQALYHRWQQSGKSEQKRLLLLELPKKKEDDEPLF